MSEKHVPIDPEAEQDFVNVLGSITNFVQNERVRAFNKGVDAAGAGFGDWQPIESAPLNKEIMIWCAGNKYERPGYQIGRMEQMAGGIVPIIRSTVYSTGAESFTHWLALPKPPGSIATGKSTP